MSEPDSLMQIVEIAAALLVLSGIFLWRHRITGSPWDAIFSLSCAVSALAATLMVPIPAMMLHEMNARVVLWMTAALLLSSGLSVVAFRYLRETV